MVLLQIFGFIFHDFPAHIKTCGGKFLLANLLERRDSTESVEDMLLREVEREREDKLCVICVDKEKCIMILPCRSYLNIICSQGFEAGSGSEIFISRRQLQLKSTNNLTKCLKYITCYLFSNLFVSLKYLLLKLHQTATLSEKLLDKESWAVKKRKNSSCKTPEQENIMYRYVSGILLAVLLKRFSFCRLQMWKRHLETFYFLNASNLSSVMVPVCTVVEFGKVISVSTLTVII